MDSIRGGFVAHTYAFAARNNETGGRKSRIRRSKEERKTMVESFIKKYQTSNGGDFPSLNLTHKEVGGSFYTVREIVREIIQENRVLAPPKKQDEFDFLEQNPLGSISVEPEISFSVCHGVQSETITGSPNSSLVTFHESGTSKSGNEQITDGLRDGNVEDEGSDSSKGHTVVGEDSNTGGQSHKPEENITLNEAIQENAHFDEQHITDDVRVPISDVENARSALEFDHVSSELGNRKVPSELQINHESAADKTEEFSDGIHEESEVKQIVDAKTSVSNVVDQSKVLEFLATSNVAVETFPLRPVARTVTVTDVDDDKHVSDQITPISGNKIDETKLPRSAVKVNDGSQDKKISSNLREPSSESVKHSSSTVVNFHDHAKQVESKDSLQSRNKVSSLKTEHSKTVGSKTLRDTSPVASQSSPTLDRVHLETWEGTSKKSTERKTNPLLAFVKALVSAWTKLWT